MTRLLKKSEPVLSILHDAILRLRNHGIDEDELDAKYIVSHVLGVSTHALYTQKTLAVSPRQQRQIQRMLSLRIKGKPLQYILGNQPFYGLTFKVSPRVLIPRPETELLVDKTLKTADAFDAPDILDLCTGSGCIAVTLKTKLPKASITASDISRAALRVAKANAKTNEVDVRFIHSNLFKRIPGTFDIIVTNPPYINQADYDALDKKVHDFEPSQALVSGEDGLNHIRAIISQADHHLNPGGWLLMEIGYDQRNAAETLMQEHGFDEIRTFSDYGGFDRIVAGKRI